MKKLLFLLFFPLCVHAQTVVTLSTADTSKIVRTTGTTNAELILRNGTRSVTNGIAYNSINGWIKYGIVGYGLIGGSTFLVDTASNAVATKAYVNNFASKAYLSTWPGSTSITTLGTIGTGTWNGSLITGQYGGTGVANTGKTITLGGNLTTTPANAITFTTTGTTNVTLPTSGTLATTSQLLWQRASTTLSPVTANDNVDIGTGTYTGGKIEVNTTSDSGTPDAAIRINRTLSGATSSGHGFRDQTTFTTANVAYNPYDAQVVMGSGTNVNFDHIAQFQARSRYNSTGTLNNYYGFEFLPFATGSGTITNMYGLHVGALQSGTPTITNNYAIKIDSANAGSNRYGVVQRGAQVNIFEGDVSHSTASFTGNLTANSKIIQTTSTSPSAQGQQGWNNSAGYYIYPKAGSDYDYFLYNSAGSATLYVPTGTTNVIVSGNITAANLSSGTYTPTLSSTTNVASSTAYQSFYQRVGDIVYVDGNADITPTGAGAVIFNISLPIASNLATSKDLSGLGTTSIETQIYRVTVYGDATNDKAQVSATAIAGAANIAFHFSYKII